MCTESNSMVLCFSYGFLRKGLQSVAMVALSRSCSLIGALLLKDELCSGTKTALVHL